MNDIPNKYINSFDIDGVIYMGDIFTGVFPGPDDIIITSRTFEESEATNTLLHNRGIHNKVFMNTSPFNQKTRKSSGEYKARTLFYLEDIGYRIAIHFENDPIQAAEIRRIMPHINIVMLEHNLTEK
jgi:hypothetical protein